MKIFRWKRDLLILKNFSPWNILVIIICLPIMPLLCWHTWQSVFIVTFHYLPHHQIPGFITIVIRFAKTLHLRTPCKEQLSSSMDSSINKISNYTSTYGQMLMGLLMLMRVSEVCQTSMSARVSIECHWLACTGSHLAGNHHTTGWWYRPWI